MSENRFIASYTLKTHRLQIWLILDITHNTMFSGTRTQFWVRVPEKFSGTRLPEIPDPALISKQCVILGIECVKTHKTHSGLNTAYVIWKETVQNCRHWNRVCHFAVHFVKGRDLFFKMTWKIRGTTSHGTWKSSVILDDSLSWTEFVIWISSWYYY